MSRYPVKDLYKSVLLFFSLLTMVTGAMAQQTGIIKGRLVDTVSHQLLRDAFITVVNTSDTALKKKSLSKEDASLEVAQLPYGSYFVQITFQGFEPALRQINLNKDNPVFDMGYVYMKIQIRVLDTIRVDEPPMILKKDTIEYNAGSFQTRAYAPLSDLLEKLPGIQVNSDGSTSMNGQTVDQILVDGKPFFGGDPQMALRHLPAEIIRKIQVYTTTNEQMGLPGPPGLPGNKTINLILKSNRRKGNFGKLAAGGGPGGVFAGSVDLNHMNGSQQVSVVGDAGNVDGMNTDIPGETANGMGNSGYGITRRWSGGINYRDTWNDQTNIYGSYTNSQQRTENVQRMHSLNLFPGDSSTSLHQNTTNLTKNNLQRLNLTLESKLNAFNSLIFRPNIILQHSETQFSQQGIQNYVKSTTPIYQSSSNNNSTIDNKTISAGLLYIHKGHQPLHSLSLGLDVFSDHSDHSGFSYSKTNYFTPSTYTSNLNQHFINSGLSFTLSPSLTYTMPLGTHDALDIRCNYSCSHSSAQNQTLRYNNDTQKFDQPDKGQSNDFNNIYSTAKVFVNYRMQWKHYGITFGAGIESDHLKGEDLTKGSNIENQYMSILPAATLNIDLGKNKSLQFNYNGKPIPLTTQQLQPVSVTTDSLFIQQGNLLLKQPYMHSFSLSYTSLHIGSQRFFTAMVSGSMTLHAVQTAVTLLNNGAQVTIPVNMNGAGNIYANLNYTIPTIRPGSNINLASNISYSQNPGVTNGLKNNTRMINFSGALSWNFHSKRGLDLRVSGISGYNIMNSTLDPKQDIGYFTAAFSSRLTYIRGDWTATLLNFYAVNNSLPRDFQPLAPILSPGIGRRLLNRKAAEIKLSITDILNQQSGASRNVTPNAIVDMWSMTRGRYILLSFTYNLSKFGINK
jgi:hypothetical protein